MKSQEKQTPAFGCAAGDDAVITLPGFTLSSHLILYDC